MPDLEPGGGRVRLRLHEPPRVVNIGVGLHGVGTVRDVFLLPDLWQLHLYGYHAELTLGGLTHEIRPGHVSLIPPGHEVAFRYRGRSEHLYAHLRLPGGGPALSVPVMQDAADRTPVLRDLFSQALAAAPRDGAHADAEVWALLWRISRLPGPAAATPGGPHPAVAAATAHIELRLAEPLTVPEIARHAGVSHNHLTRLFRAETGDTVVAYLRRRRLARAEHLLRRSTLSIPAIAALVGLADLQAFNKACRRELGASPRALRG
ncbi:AraC family transcriptional regulator [Catellatospora tritici]|uniref:AraC family transcriptional regulator n=1 Tax=Catellatospora tritici TaxID=2851566 RepID=UPI001C2D865F|nr:AraC family transcriptional regulator [Catellatospora tritici]MBV1850164.1 AraC family transcriptional regulator [Catellatospora tritici]